MRIQAAREKEGFPLNKCASSVQELGCDGGALPLLELLCDADVEFILSQGVCVVLTGSKLAFDIFDSPQR